MLTIIYTYYGQRERIPGILNESHPESRVIFVDDGSLIALPQPRSLTLLYPIIQKGFWPEIEIHRINQDIPWNQPAARNLGFSHAEGWCISCDIDHLVTWQNVEDLLKLPKERGTVYFLGRDKEPPAWNTYLIHKDDFYLVGGYDEDYCGHYGWDDIDFLYRCKAKLRVERLYTIQVKNFSAESHTKLERDSRYNKKLLEAKWNL